ncbi:PBP1A family penicillin-binding protein [bacterium]|nr:PBP1A family penicillin-binding protein [bacterium]
MPRYYYKKIWRKEKKRKTKTNPIKRWLVRIKFFGTLFLIFAVIFWIYFAYLGHKVASKFEAPRRWDIPSRVYSDSKYLYPGIDIKKESIVDKLNRLGYRNVGQKIKGPGDFAHTNDFLDIFLHNFDYPMEKFEGFPIRITLNSNIIREIVDLELSKPVPTIRLEPEQIATLFDEKMEDRTLVSIKDVPPHLLEAIIMIEDARFFNHHGVDPIGIIRAFGANILAGKIVQGGSTLTQQLIKNYFLHPGKNITRKINEALMALVMEWKYSKAEILEAYLNEIYLGQRGPTSVSGVGEAARYYFAKDAKQLTIAEGATIAAMIKNPYFYSPHRDKENTINRRNFILKRMYEGELISENEYQNAVKENIILPKSKLKIVNAPYFIDFVKQQLGALYSEEILESEGLRIFTTLDMQKQLIAERAVSSGLARLNKAFGSLLPKDNKDPLQGALISLSPQTGYVEALVGGRDYKESQFNRITQARRQPGSVFKPFVYLTAFSPERGKHLYTAATTIEDTYFTVKSGGEDWSPVNYDKEEHGEVTLRRALENSYNVATAKLAIDIGLGEIVQTARDAGITSDLQPVPALALGAFEVTPLEIASAYTIFANNGMRVEPLAIRHVVTKGGQPLQQKNIKLKRRFEPQPVYITTSIMKGVLDRGTGRAARLFGFNGIAAGKTGTTNNYRDAWFVGYTPNLLSLVWVGFDNNQTTNMSGARAALPIWADYMKSAVGDSNQDFASPRDVILVKIDPNTGGVATKRCPQTFYEVFLEGTQPEEPCPVHTKFKK